MSADSHTPTQYGFNFGPMIVERVAHDEQIGWVVVVRDADYRNQVTIRCSPTGRNWNVHEQTRRRKRGL